MATRKTIEEQIAEQEKKKQQLEARIKQLKARQSATERKERTRRLIEVGAIVEKGLGVELKSEEQKEALLEILTEQKKDKNGNIFTNGSWLKKQVEKKTKSIEERPQSSAQESAQQQQQQTQERFYSNDNRFE